MSRVPFCHVERSRDICCSWTIAEWRTVSLVDLSTALEVTKMVIPTVLEVTKMGLPTTFCLTLLCYPCFSVSATNLRYPCFLVSVTNLCESAFICVGKLKLVIPSVPFCHSERPALSCRAKSRHLLFQDKSRVENTIACRPLDCARGDKNGSSDYVLTGIVVLSRFFLLSVTNLRYPRFSVSVSHPCLSVFICVYLCLSVFICV